MIRTALLTISDSSSAGTRTDATGPALAGLCKSAGWSVEHTAILPDDRAAIAAALRTLADTGRFDVIISAGGTGIAARDVTPEAVRDVLDKELPGLGELMRAEGLKHTRRAVLSRSLAGTRHAALIVCLPGSPKGAVQSLNAILDLVAHITELLRGHTAHADEAKLG